MGAYINRGGTMAKGNRGGHNNGGGTGNVKVLSQSADDILSIIDNSEYEYYGIRVDDNVDYDVGDETVPSRLWIDGDATDEELDGTSAVGIAQYATKQDIDNAISIAQSYYGKDVYLIGSDDRDFGEDYGEYVMKNAVVLGRFKKR